MRGVSLHAVVQFDSSIIQLLLGVHVAARHAMLLIPRRCKVSSQLVLRLELGRPDNGSFNHSANFLKKTGGV